MNLSADIPDHDASLLDQLHSIDQVLQRAVPGDIHVLSYDHETGFTLGKTSHPNKCQAAIQKIHELIGRRDVLGLDDSPPLIAQEHGAILHKIAPRLQELTSDADVAKSQFLVDEIWDYNLMERASAASKSPAEYLRGLPEQQRSQACFALLRRMHVNRLNCHADWPIIEAIVTHIDRNYCDALGKTALTHAIELLQKGHPWGRYLFNKLYRLPSDSNEPPPPSQSLETVVKQSVEDRATLRNLRAAATEALGKGTPGVEVARTMSTGIRELMARIYQEGEAHLRNQGITPPCGYSVVVCGSLARNESGPYPDFDNFILVEHSSPEVTKYFQRLQQHVADRVYRFGESFCHNKPGIRLCSGNLNPPYHRYEWRYTSLPSISTSGSSDMLLPVPIETIEPRTLLLDGLPLCGTRPDLYTTFCMHASREAMERDVHGTIQLTKKLLDWNKHSYSVEGDELPALIHIKGDIHMPLGLVIGALARYYNIPERSTCARIEALRTKGFLNNDLASKLAAAMAWAQKWRIQVQSAHGEEFEMVVLSQDASERFMRTRNAKLLELQGEPPSETNSLAVRRYTAETKLVETAGSKPNAFTDSDREAFFRDVLPALLALKVAINASLGTGQAQEFDPKAFA